MNLPVSISRKFSSPFTLWGLFAIVLLMTTIGLGMLSRHALDLSRQQWISERESDSEQNIRIALWRIDSRLGPYLATLHDSSGTLGLGDQPNDFVVQRFRLEQRPTSDEQSPRYSILAMSDQPGASLPGFGISTPDDDHRLQQLIPIETLVSTVDAQIPFTDSEPSQTPLVQFYGNQPTEAQRLDRGLSSRNLVVQQQVAMNNSLQLLPTPRSNSPLNLLPVWTDDKLVIVRVNPSLQPRTIEGVLLDWELLEQSLLTEISDLTPGARITPVQPDDEFEPSRTLAALPAVIIPAAMPFSSPGWSATHTALSLAWLALLGSAVIAAIALSRLIALSERRASFVSAVTHELRTPLTTFRLYSDLLARDMVQDPNDRKEYLQTLRREADRLTHLVDNVLRYSRLQRTSKGIVLETVKLSDWIERIKPRLSERLASAEMELIVEQESDGDWKTDPAAVEQVLFNLIDNAAKYAQDATDRRVHLIAAIDNDKVVLTVTDHGQGVPDTLKSTIFKPFAKSAERAAETAAGVGLGLALARQTAVALGGKLVYKRAASGGASFRLQLPRR